MLEQDESDLKPLITLDDGCSFFYKSVNNITFLAVSKNNVNAIMVYSFIYAYTIFII